MPETVPKYKMEFGNAERLGVFCHSHRFFTPALLYLYGRFTDDFLADFLASYKKPCPFLHRRFDKPVFSGMTTPDGDAEWNHVLWAVEADAYPALENYLLSVAIAEPEYKVVYRVGAQDINVSDPLAVDLGWAALRPIPVTVLGVDGSDWAIALRPPARVDGQPTLSFFPSRPQARAFARAYFDGEDYAAALDAEVPVRHNLDPSPLRLQADVSAETRDRLVRELAEYRKAHP